MYSFICIYDKYIKFMQTPLQLGYRKVHHSPEFLVCYPFVVICMGLFFGLHSLSLICVFIPLPIPYYILLAVTL